MKLRGQVALITGAGSGLGAAIAAALAGEGAACALAGRRRDRLAAVAARLGPAARIFACDVADETQVAGLMADLIEAFGRLDLLVNSAGVFHRRPFEATTPEFWDQTINSNLRGVYLVCRAAWPHLTASRGQIVNISSVAGVQGFSGSAAYCASKFGVNGLTEVLALEGKPHGLRAFAVCPAQTDTPIWEGQAPPEVRARMMPPEIVADLVRWLVTAPRQVELPPIVIRNFNDPWVEPADSA